ncbi:MAG: ribosome silencing factor [Methylobacter sp.]|uniref:Ribosomal silencing factor RsfS n=1 Tax=Candidatus Methylobacter titanis TaxID=3053457 RepID=A0AA43Q1K9_9GAMM|nr:ribosome silencing factor [Candidatus Methylobacter titanis]MDI1292809.1 ribosome silencing factor [Candidatus Methylobacter titanis]
MQAEQILKIVQEVLDERKGQNITTLDVRGKTSFTDYMVVVTGTSDRHLKSLCDYVAEKLKESGIKPLGIEGDLGSDWVLLDLGDVIVHAMNAQARGFYQLEKLWSVDDSKESEQQLG